MMSKDEYLVFVGQIVAEIAPSEKTAFAVAGPQLADSLYSGQGISAVLDKRPSSEFQFLDVATQVLQFVGLMIGTFSTIEKFIKSVKPYEDVDLKQKLASQWAHELRHYGLSEATAAEIAERFSDELAIAMKRI
jgi:hypothetical protein